MTTQAIQAQAFQEATANLGALQGRFDAKGRMLLAIIGVIVLLLAVLVGGQALGTDAKDPDRQPMFIFTIIFGLLGAYLMYRWNQIKDLKIDRGYISVKQEGGRWFNWAQVTADSVPNLFVFLALIDNIVGIRTGR